MSVKIILHCSDSPFGNAALIAKWHIQERGWKGIGYHYVILNGWITSGIYHPDYDGHLETGRPLDNDPVVEKSEIGAHVKGHNYNSVGICLIGNSGKFTEKQMNTVLELLYRLENTFGDVSILQHSDLDPVDKPHCAGLSMSRFMNDYNLYKKGQDNARNREGER